MTNKSYDISKLVYTNKKPKNQVWGKNMTKKNAISLWIVMALVMILSAVLKFQRDDGRMRNKANYEIIRWVIQYIRFLT